MYDDFPTVYETSLNQNFIYLIILGIILLILLVISLLSLAKIFKKANRFGISAFIPIYNIIMLLEITNSAKWYLLLLLIPGVNIIFYLLVMFSLARFFKKSKAFAVGLTFLPFIFYPILAFGDSEYIGINLVAMEGKNIVTDIPTIIDSEEKNPVIHKEQDTASKNINISIGGGVYQKDYTNNLLEVDEKQTIPNSAESIQNAPSATSQFVDSSKPSFIAPIEEEIQIVEMEPKNASIEFPNPILSTEKNQKENNTNMLINQSDNQNISQDIHSIESVISQSTQNALLAEDTPSIINSKIQTFTNQKPAEKLEFISCPKCGAKVKSDAKVCFLCGHRLD